MESFLIYCACFTGRFLLLAFDVVNHIFLLVTHSQLDLHALLAYVFSVIINLPHDFNALFVDSLCAASSQLF